MAHGERALSRAPLPADAFDDERPLRSLPPKPARSPYLFALLFQAFTFGSCALLLVHKHTNAALYLYLSIAALACTILCATFARKVYFYWPAFCTAMLALLCAFGRGLPEHTLVVTVAALFGATLIGATSRKYDLKLYLFTTVPITFAALYTLTYAKLSPTKGLGLSIAGALFVTAFALLGRVLLYGTVRTLARSERERTDAELLRYYDDARLFRMVGRSKNADGARRTVAATEAMRDALYRLLRLGSGALACDHAYIYLLDPGEKTLLLQEQFSGSGHHQPQEGVSRLPLHSSPLRLAVERSAPLRLNRQSQNAFCDHRSGPMGALLLTPIRSAQSVVGVLVFDRVARAPFHEADETVALALADEIAHAATTERAMRALDDERREKTRVFTAARAFGGVVKRSQAVSVALKSANDVATLDAAVFVELNKSGNQETLIARQSIGKGAHIFDELLGTPLPFDAETWVGRAIAQGTALPHVPLSQISQARGVLEQKDKRAKAFGDLRAIPLFAQGERTGALIVATPKEARFSRTALDSLGVIADLAGVSFSGSGAYEKLERQARTDGLTGLLNRRSLDDALKNATARAERSNAQVSVILSDIDHFKSVNDTYGHSVGDEVLVRVAAVFLECARATDVVARYGGEEFCVVLENTDQKGAALLAERMRQEIAKCVFESDAGSFSVTSSFGVATYPEHAKACDAIVTAADVALYRAKESGRNRVLISE